ncbi:MAG: flavin reductase family protein [Acidimicrobiales bacterium]
MDRDLKRCLGQMMKGVQVVASHHEGLTRGYCSHWVMQVSFEEPVMLASISPKHDTHALIEKSGWFTVSNLAADQVDVGQYFSYPGRKFKHIATEYLTTAESSPWPVIADCISWVKCDVLEKLEPAEAIDHNLYLVGVTDFGEGRLGEPPLLYSSRHGWRVAGDKARQPGRSIRDELLERLETAELTSSDGEPT